MLTTGVLGAGAALVLAGCGAGQITQTDTMPPAVNGASVKAGAISVRNAAVVNNNQCLQAYASGDSAPLTLTIANDGNQADELLSVSSTGASGATVAGDKTIAGVSRVVVGPANQAESAAAASATPSTAPGVGSASIVLQGLKAPLWPGQLIPVTFTFRNAGAVNADLPIAAPTKTLTCETTVEKPRG
ncbi:copper chaperone PCu(A)C [Amycolatopsis cynarae]|uniref:Copper chaperone PCu(A)C n=1 Tax=Amycolatopsis cynarae TaxID=2995223 RepID=A0ABY7B5U5_9PSEU|nr:copper chaperone PCu(A)C [Amycolatopsis sp. HUAS 11-8]WAL66158.1 copper chaperone PCu(A)C [Amycolatopsis sp. HUAS 11-8]